MTVKAVNLNGYKTKRARARRSRRANSASDLVELLRMLGMTDAEIKAAMLKAQVFELRERLKEAEDRAARWEALDAEAQIGADEVSRQLRDLKAELADVRAQWASDVGSAIARAQTAEARAARLNTEVGYLLEENEEMGRREIQRAAAARKVAQFARKNMAAMQHVQRAQRERDAARAEAARYAEALANSDPWTNDVPFNCVYCDAVWDSDIGSSENQHNAGCVWIAAAALRGPAQSE